MKAVVTGSAGFIGSHLVQRLIGRDCRVTGIDLHDLLTRQVDAATGVPASVAS